LLQQDVAERLRWPQPFVSKYESGARRIDLIELLDVLRALDFEPHEFIDLVCTSPRTTLLRQILCLACWQEGGCSKGTYIGQAISVVSAKNL